MVDPILIAGGGIGGLSAAVALARAGFPVRILERMDTFSEAGSGMQIGPNAMCLLEHLGAAELVSAYGAVPEGIRIFAGRNADILTTIPLGRQAKERYGAPSIVVRRAHLQQCLLEAAWSQTDLEISTGFQLTGYESNGDGVEVFDRTGTGVRGRALIGADGLRSAVRAQIHETHPQTVGKTAWRTTIRTSDAPPVLAEPYIGIWMAPYSYLVHYPVDAGKVINLVAIVEDTYHFDGWGAKGDPQDLLPHFHDWDDLPRSLLEQLSDWSKWTLFTMEPLSSWGVGCVTLLGDAAHPIQPYLAQGSAMAIEDAAVLADEIRKAPDDLPAALKHYERLRAPRTSRVQRASNRLGRISHSGGALRWVRDLVLRRRRPLSVLAGYDWLYDSAGALWQPEPGRGLSAKGGGSAQSAPSPS